MPNRNKVSYITVISGHIRTESDPHRLAEFFLIATRDDSPPRPPAPLPMLLQPRLESLPQLRVLCCGSTTGSRVSAHARCCLP